METPQANPVQAGRVPRILFAWAGPTGFMGACWRALQERGVVVLVLSVTHPGTGSFRAFDIESCLRGVDIRSVPNDGSFDRDAVLAIVRDFAPDVIFATGWSVPVVRFVAAHPTLAAIPKVLLSDMPWQLRLGKFAARFILHRYLLNFSATYVSGKSAARYARWLGFGGNRPIYTGLYATDLDRFANQTTNPRAKSFLFVGRYAPEKGLDVLLDAYEIYCDSVDEPWSLDFVGAGAYGERLLQLFWQGMTRGDARNLGFKQPEELAEVYASHGAFILPSRFEPWGVALVEAAGAGLPVICTDACGARYEVMRDGIDGNGFVARAGNVKSLAEAMVRMHNLDAVVRERMGAQSRILAAPYSATAWAERTARIVEELRRR